MYNNFYNQSLSNKKVPSVNQKNNQIIIEEIDDDNTEKNESHSDGNEKLETCKNNNANFNRGGNINCNSTNNLRSKKMNDYATPFTYYRNGNHLSNNNNLFLNENLNNNLILLSEDY